MWAQTLNEPSQAARTLRSNGYGVFAHQRDESLYLHTPNLNLHLLEKGLEGPIYGISIEERPLGHPSQSNGSSHCRETETEDWDAHAGYTRCHTRTPYEHIW